MLTVLLAALIACGGSDAPAPTEAEKPAEPQKEAAATGATLAEALDAALTKRLGQPATAPGEWTEKDGFAYLSTDKYPQKAGGGDIDPSVSGNLGETGDPGVYALAKKDGSVWTILEVAYWCTDMCMVGWEAKHGAPAEVFPEGIRGLQ